MRHVAGIEPEIENPIGFHEISQNRNAVDRGSAHKRLAVAPTERERDVAIAIAMAQRERRKR